MPGLFYYLFKGIGYFFYGIFWGVFQILFGSIYIMLICLYSSLMLVLFPFVVLFTGNFKKYFINFRKGIEKLTLAFYGKYLKGKIVKDQPTQITDKPGENDLQLTESTSIMNSNPNEFLHCAACGEQITEAMRIILRKGEECFCEFCGQQIRLPE